MWHTAERVFNIGLLLPWPRRSPRFAATLEEAAWFLPGLFTQSLGSKQQNDHQNELYGTLNWSTYSGIGTSSASYWLWWYARLRSCRDIWWPFSWLSKWVRITKGTKIPTLLAWLFRFCIFTKLSLQFAFHPPVMVEAPLKGDIIKQNEDIMQEFQHTAHGAWMQVLTCLCGEEILNLHHPDRPSRTNSVFLRYPHDAPSEAVGHN